ncbi:uncharacterized protein H6S33_011749 [Morchella sextelata]|uniref:uncharacterized protein n=1 Tax=Morchella sextelata TaxID=1174677 RepID=UPI001D03FFA8|nr:uncharacterized protein H6S33_011749 [Morchella sextelata]KAH0610222.1 hypothetical protein H6S33_011749 [Morchella sextelata]
MFAIFEQVLGRDKLIWGARLDGFWRFEFYITSSRFITRWALYISQTPEDPRLSRHGYRYQIKSTTINYSDVAVWRSQD